MCHPSILRNGPCRYFLKIPCLLKIVQCRLSNLRKGCVARSNLRVKDLLEDISCCNNHGLMCSHILSFVLIALKMHFHVCVLDPLLILEGTIWPWADFIVNQFTFYEYNKPNSRVCVACRF